LLSNESARHKGATMQKMKTDNSPTIRYRAVLLSILAVLCLSSITFADRALRCQGRLVHIGDLRADVVSKCGEPDHIEKWEENPHGTTFQIYDYEKERYHLPERIKGPVHIERWTYDLGANRFTRYLFFQNGELYKIERGDK
jgi:hypothetical protein